MERKFTLLGLIILFFIGLNLPIFAQVQVGTGTVTSTSLPIEPYYGYTYSQVIYLASEINSSGTITELQWYFNGSSLSNSNDWTIYIGHTSKTEFSSSSDWIPVSSMTQVYSATFADPGASGWITFDITDWVYNGTDNIVVAVDENASNYNSGGDDFYCTSVSDSRGIEFHADGTNPDPLNPPSGNTKSYIANIIFGGIAQACPNPSAQTETNMTDISVDLGWTENGTSTTWNIEWGITGFTQGSGTMISGTTTNPHALSGLSSATTYDWYVQADCGGGSSSNWIGPSTFITEQTPASVQSLPFTEDWETGAIGAAWNTDAGSVSTIVVNTTSKHDGTYGLEQYANSNAYAAPSGLADAYTKALPGGVNENWTTWNKMSVDLTSATNPWLSFWYSMGYQYNDNFNNFWLQVSTDGSTWIDLFSTQTNGDHISYEKKNYDLSAYNGTAQLYIRFFHSGKYRNNYVRLDDISVMEVSCPNPSTQTETNITHTSVDLSWTEIGSATNWEIEWGTTGFTQGSGTIVTTTNNPYTLGGLSATTTYDWYVRASCGGGDYSDWVGSSTFTTQQTPAPIQSLPFSEGWETGAIGAAWNYDAGSISTIEVNTASVHNETYGLTQYGNLSSGYSQPSGLADAYTKALPNGVNENWTTWNRMSVDMTTATSPWLSFWYAMGYNYEDDYNNFWVQASTDGSTWTDLFSTQTSGADIPYEKKDIDLSAYNGTAQLFIRFFHNGKYDDNYLWLDDITVSIVTCPTPSNQAETNITSSSAITSWTENGSANTWNIEWGPTGFTQGSGTVISTINNPYTLSGLSANTTYDWYVQSSCGGGDASLWFGKSTFTTLCDIASIPYFENFDAETVPNFPVCMAVENTNGDQYQWETSLTHSSAPNSAMIRYHPSIPMDDWFFTQGLQLTGGTTYEVAFSYSAASGYPEKLAVDWGTDATSVSMSGTPIFDEIGILGGWYSGNGSFTPTTTGTYYVGFHGYSDADKFYLYVDDIKVIEVVATTSWVGTVDNDWNTPGNWSNGLPASTTDITIPTGLTNYPTLTTPVECDNITIESDATGDGSLIENGYLTVNGTATAQRYIGDGQWHGISAPVAGATAQSLYSTTANVYLKEHHEYDPDPVSGGVNIYTWVTDLSDPLGDMKGLMMWYDGTTGETFDITGDLRGSTTVGSTDNMVRSGADTDPDWYGWNFVGNPYTSAIDWNAASGWTKTGIDGTIYLYNNGVWVTWNGTAGTNGGTQYIAMGQGFFVNVTDVGSYPSYATLTMTNEVQVHNSIGYLKNQKTIPSELVRLEVSNEVDTDETVIYFEEEATKGFDAQFDAHKLFSFSSNKPHIFSSENNKMAINVLPIENAEVPIDVSGVDGEDMIISN